MWVGRRMGHKTHLKNSGLRASAHAASAEIGNSVVRVTLLIPRSSSTDARAGKTPGSDIGSHGNQHEICRRIDGGSDLGLAHRSRDLSTKHTGLCG